MLTKLKATLWVRRTLSNYSNHHLHHHHHHPWSRAYRSNFNTWALAISRAASSPSPLTALRLFKRMKRQSVPSDSFSILFALKSCNHLPRSLTAVRHLHAHLLKLGFPAHVYVATALLSAYSSVAFPDACNLFDEMPHRNTITWNIMITGYSRKGDIKTARVLFDVMPLRDLASWSAIIAAYMDNSLWNNGLSLFRQMMSGDECVAPDQLTLGPVLAGCGRMGLIGSVLGKSIHGFIIKNEWELNVQIGTCLVDMYGKCGLLKKACLVFDMMKGRNVVAWTALIRGAAAHHGYAREALLIFDRMREVGVEPNELTFTAVLMACAQEGLVEEGRGYFRLIKECGMNPTIQHYGCMVDLLGKEGLLGEAREVIKTMPFEANVVIWGSFLSSCKLHKQYQMGEQVVDEVMRMIRPENDGGVYSIISDLYALNGKWSEVERLRDLMLCYNVRKVRGSSRV